MNTKLDILLETAMLSLGYVLLVGVVYMIAGALAS